MYTHPTALRCRKQAKQCDSLGRYSRTEISNQCQMSRTTFYKWRSRFQASAGDPAFFLDRSPVRGVMPNQTLSSGNWGFWTMSVPSLPRERAGLAKPCVTVPSSRYPSCAVLRGAYERFPRVRLIALLPTFTVHCVGFGDKLAGYFGMLPHHTGKCMQVRI